jgi:hypothetical protein
MRRADNVGRGEFDAGAHNDALFGAKVADGEIVARSRAGNGKLDAAGAVLVRTETWT